MASILIGWDVTYRAELSTVSVKTVNVTHSRLQIIMDINTNMARKVKGTSTVHL